MAALQNGACSRSAAITRTISSACTTKDSTRATIATRSGLRARDATRAETQLAELLVLATEHCREWALVCARWGSA
ncbi:MAG TPA: hypothetical protein VF526_21325 [Solirubrobacteraceae bacterium]